MFLTQLTLKPNNSSDGTGRFNPTPANLRADPQEAAYQGRKHDAESKSGLDVSKKKQGRGRATSTGRGRSSKADNDVTKSQFLVAPVSAASQLDLSDQKDFRPDGEPRNGECFVLDDGIKILLSIITLSGSSRMYCVNAFEI